MDLVKEIGLEGIRIVFCILIEEKILLKGKGKKIFYKLIKTIMFVNFCWDISMFNWLVKILVGAWVYIDFILRIYCKR